MGGRTRSSASLYTILSVNKSTAHTLSSYNNTKCHSVNAILIGWSGGSCASLEEG